jgi:hypothetical protein
MLRQIQSRASERQLRLFVCACARLVWDQLPDGPLREAVEVGERHADGRASDDERQEFVHRLYSPWGKPTRPATWFGGKPWGEQSADDWSAFFAAKLAVSPRTILAKMPVGPGWEESARLTGAQQPALLREVFGTDPVRPAAFDPCWRTPDVVTLAGHVYRDRAFGLLPELAEVLEQAGCRDQAVLTHCRSTSTHHRGCWVLDLVLAKE